jgi:ADP-ribosyl-[dinitrogen reductase] hydrolase
MSAPTAALPPLPLRHSYWVVPGLLLAGEYPGGSTRDKTKDRLKKLLAAGIECFVDLTRPTELLRYDTHLPFYVEYTRKAIKDHGIPGSRAQMIEILDYVGNAMRAGRPVYVHCRAGIGRTGTVIGCLLVERGMSGDGALDELNRLWQQCKRSKSWAYIPETESQAAFVREWKPSLQIGGFELSHAAAAVSAVGPMSAGADLRADVLTVADVQARSASQATGAGQARAAMQNLATGQGRGGSNKPGASYPTGAGLSASAAEARAAVERGEAAPRNRAHNPEAPAGRNGVSSAGGDSAVRADGTPISRMTAQQSVNSRASAVVPAPSEPVESDPLLDPATLEAARGLRERFVGTLFGLAIGDAVAAATQFRRPGSFSPIGDMIGGGPFDLPRGAWSDDTAMALCLAESLLERNEFDARDQVQRYGRWQQEGYLSSTGQCVGITASTARSLAIAKWRRVVFPGSHDPEQLDPEPLSRVASIALFYFASLETTLHQAAESSRTTCQAPAVLDACRRLGRALNAALSGHAKAHILAEASPISEAVAQTNSTAAAALAAAFWAFSSTDNFRDAVLRAANVGGNSDVVASVCGQLAGAHYGFSAIPSSWRNSLMHKDLIEGYADRLLAHGLVSLSS